MYCVGIALKPHGIDGMNDSQNIGHKEVKMLEKFYFAQDGSYGVWDDGSILVETDSWTASDWENVENCSDSERTFVVRGIVNKYVKKMGGAI